MPRNPFNSLSLAWNATRFFWATSYTVTEAIVRDAYTPVHARNRMYLDLTSRWATDVLRIFSIQLVGDSTRMQGTRTGRLVVANHRSALDIPILLSLSGGYIVSRADVAKWPVVGAGARKAGTIFVDRAKASSGAAALLAIRQKLQENQTVILFPEGTTFAGDQVRPLRRGALNAAYELGAEILPVGLAYENGAEWVNEGFGKYMARMNSRRPIRVAVRLGAPVQVETYSETAPMARAAIQCLVHEARSLL